MEHGNLGQGRIVLKRRLNLFVTFLLILPGCEILVMEFTLPSWFTKCLKKVAGKPWVDPSV